MINQQDSNSSDSFSGQFLQQRIDQLARQGGGRLEIPRGVYRLRNALHLRSGVHLVGEPDTILAQEPGFETPILDYLGYGHYEVTVRDAHRFSPGMGIHIFDDGSMGFYTTQASVTAVDGERIFIDRPLNHDYNPESNARAANVFSLIEGAWVHDVSVEGLTLRGHPDDDYRALNGCRGGGLFLIGCRNVALQELTIEDYRGDALSFQQCLDTRVSGCVLRRNRGGGLHPGSGSVRYYLVGNRIHDNAECGIFYCLRTTHSECRANCIENNGAYGISVGERDTHHLILDNQIRGNAHGGLEFRTPRRQSGDACRVEGNLFEHNGGSQHPEITVAAGLRDIAMLGNRFTTTRKPVIQLGASERIVVGGNHLDGIPLTAADIESSGNRPATVLPDTFPAIGPEAVGADDVRHLGVQLT